MPAGLAPEPCRAMEGTEAHVQGSACQWPVRCSTKPDWVPTGCDDCHQAEQAMDASATWQTVVAKWPGLRSVLQAVPVWGHCQSLQPQSELTCGCCSRHGSHAGDAPYNKDLPPIPHCARGFLCGCARPTLVQTGQMFWLPLGKHARDVLAASQHAQVGEMADKLQNTHRAPTAPLYA